MVRPPSTGHLANWLMLKARGVHLFRYLAPACPLSTCSVLPWKVVMQHQFADFPQMLPASLIVLMCWGQKHVTWHTGGGGGRKLRDGNIYIWFAVTQGQLSGESSAFVYSGSLASYTDYLPLTLITCLLRWLFASYADYLPLALVICLSHWLFASRADYLPLALIICLLRWLFASYADYLPLTLIICLLHWLLSSTAIYTSSYVRSLWSLQNQSSNTEAVAVIMMLLNSSATGLRQVTCVGCMQSSSIWAWENF